MAGDGESGKGRKSPCHWAIEFLSRPLRGYGRMCRNKTCRKPTKTNVFSQQWDAEAEMKPYDTRIMAWAPLAQGDPDLLTNPILTALAERYNKRYSKSPCVTWCNAASSPSRKHAYRANETNLDVFDFTLTPEDMESIRPLDKPADFRWSHRNPELVKFLLNYDKQFNPNNK